MRFFYAIKCSMQGKLFIQWDRFFSSKIAKTFSSKMSVSCEVRYLTFWGGKFGFGSLLCQIFLRFHWHLSNLQLFSRHSARTTSFWSGRSGFESEPYLSFFVFVSNCWDRNVSETRIGSPTNVFGTLGQKI